MLEKFFKLAENQTTIRTEILAGITTFLTMAYIIVVQPAVLSGAMFDHPTGMDFGAVMTATCLAAALATAVMAVVARYPIAQAPGMGENFFFVFTAIPAATAAGFANGWQGALGAVFLSGAIFLVFSLVGLREVVFNAISPSMKSAVAAGIGLFIAFIGLQDAGLVLKDPGTAVKLNPHLLSPDLIVFLLTLLATAALMARRVRGAILLGIVGATIVSAGFKWVLPYFPHWPDAASSMLASRFQFASTLLAPPPSLGPTFFKLDVRHALTPQMVPVVLVFLFMFMFDAIGTLVGVCEQAGFMRANKLPRAGRAMISDSVGTIAGACLGTSTVTSFIESAAGVEQGGRTGLTGMVVALLFLAALFFSPLAIMIGNYPPITAPALVLVGAMMARQAAKVEWNDYSECIPAFLTLIGIPMFFSIADGLALGFMAGPIVKLCSGRGRQVPWISYALALVLILYFAFVRSRMP